MRRKGGAAAHAPAAPRRAPYGVARWPAAPYVVIRRCRAWCSRAPHGGDDVDARPFCLPGGLCPPAWWWCCRRASAAPRAAATSTRVRGGEGEVLPYTHRRRAPPGARVVKGEILHRAVTPVKRRRKYARARVQHATRNVYRRSHRRRCIVTPCAAAHGDDPRGAPAALRATRTCCGGGVGGRKVVVTRRCWCASAAFMSSYTYAPRVRFCGEEEGRAWCRARRAAAAAPAAAACHGRAHAALPPPVDVLCRRRLHAPGGGGGVLVVVEEAVCGAHGTPACARPRYLVTRLPFVVVACTMRRERIMYIIIFLLICICYYNVLLYCYSYMNVIRVKRGNGSICIW